MHDSSCLDLLVNVMVYNDRDPARWDLRMFSTMRSKDVTRKAKHLRLNMAYR